MNLVEEKKVVEIKPAAKKAPVESATVLAERKLSAQETLPFDFAQALSMEEELFADHLQKIVELRIREQISPSKGQKLIMKPGQTK